MTDRLKLVPPRPTTPKEAVIERIKKYPNDDGYLQCPRCGCRAAITIRVGARIENGRLHPGKAVASYICSECYKSGLEISMLPPTIRRAK